MQAIQCDAACPTYLSAFDREQGDKWQEGHLQAAKLARNWMPIPGKHHRTTCKNEEYDQPQTSSTHH